MGVVAQPTAIGQASHALEGAALDLADPLAREPQRFADLLQRAALAVLEAEAHAQDPALASVERGQQPRHLRLNNHRHSTRQNVKSSCS